jgi:hypothetical protein
MSHKGSAILFLLAVAWYIPAMAQVPATPTGLNPADGAVDVPVLPEFRWTSAEGATSYQVQVSENVLFLGTVINVTGIVDTTYTDATPLGYSTGYYWRVRGVNAEGDGGWSSSLDFTTAPEPPPAPAPIDPPLGAVDVQTKPTFAWNPADRADSYRLTVATDGSFTSPVVDVSGLAGTTFTPDPALAVNTTYYWRVNATNPGGTSGWSSIWSFTTYPTNPPVPLLVSPSDGATEVPTQPTLAWGLTPGADTYDLQVATDPAFDTLVVDETGLTETSLYLAVLLESAGTYHWRVSAANSGGASGWSAAWVFTVTGSLPEVPLLAAPADETLDAPLTTNLSWNIAGGADSYTLQVSVDSTFATLIVDASGITGTSYLVSGLSRETRYHWRVNASNGIGTSGWSETWSFGTIPQPPSTPTPLQPPDGATDVVHIPTFEWSKPEKAYTYDFQLSVLTPKWDEDWPDIDITGLTDTAFVSTLDLYGGTVYYWHVRAVNAGGTSSWSTEPMFTTLLEAPLAPLPYSPDNGATGVAPGLLLIGWYAATDNPADFFRLQVSKEADFVTTVVDRDSITGTETLVTGLDNNYTYYWRVNGTNVVGTGPWSEVWNFTTEDGPPEPPTLASPPDGTADLGLLPTFVWHPGLAATSYDLQVSTSASFGSSVINETGIVDTSDTVTTPLNTSTTYYWRVRSVNDLGTSSWTGGWSFTTIPPPTAPPVALEARDVVDSSFTALWNAAVGADSYRLDVAVDSLFSSLLAGYDDLVVGDTSQEVTGLSPETYYYYRVRAVNIGGTSGTSDTVEVMTQVQRPDVPVAVESTDASDSSFVAHWEITARATEYRLDVATDSLFGAFVSGYQDRVVSELSDTVWGLTASSTYYYRVRGVNAGGTSGNSNIIEATTLAITAHVMVLLEGPYTDPGMGTALNSSGYLPTHHPYSGSPWNYGSADSVSTLPGGMVDWVLLELRSDMTTIVGRRAALLLSDGSVVDTNGTSPVSFPGINKGSYYLVIHHRNHLCVMSAAPVSLNESSPLYDFTTGSDKYHGTTGAAKDLGSGAWGMVGGNGDNADQDCFSSDLAIARSGILGGLAGYELGDCNMDGDVFPDDYALSKVNVLDGRSSFVPAGSEPGAPVVTSSVNRSTKKHDSK